jgi:O-antigen/teichoic acid export membrane protein
MTAPSQVRAGLVAAFASRAFTAVVALVAVPMVVARLGYEAYGLVGFHGALQALMLLLDLGLSLTLNRELARLRVLGDAREMRDVLRTLEIVYWLVGIVVFAALAPLAPWIAGRWLRPAALPADAVAGAVVLMLAVVSARWPLTLYAGGLAGLQRQVALGWITAVLAAVQNLGVVWALDTIGPTLPVFFGWHLAAGLANTLVAGVALWRALPPAPGRPAFRMAILRRVGAFAATTGGTSILGVLTQQLDKVILSRLLSLEQFGFYSLASVAAGALYRLVEPVYAVFYPRLTELVTAGDPARLAAFYHRASQIVALLVVPAATVLAVFAPEALWLWTRDPAAVGSASLLLALLAAGTALNGLVAMPYALQLASGWPQLSFRLNVVSLLVAAPGMAWLAVRFGAPGAASVWIGVNLFFLLIDVHLMHRRLLAGEEGRWYRQDVLGPLAAGVAAALAVRLAWPATPGGPWTAATFATAAAVTLAATAAALPAARAWMARRTGTGEA